MAVFVLCVGYEYGCGVVVSLTTNGPSLLFLDFYVMRRHIEATTRAPARSEIFPFKEHCHVISIGSIAAELLRCYRCTRTH